MTNIKINAKIKCHGGELIKFQHQSKTVHTPMNVNVFLPKQYDLNKDKIPAILYLSGLTCTPDNASEKAGMFQYANEYSLAVILPDTSPRGAKIKGEDSNWDFGTGAGFYINATKEPFNKNYQMYDYILNELIELIKFEFNGINIKKIGIMGHSMGGFGSIMFYLKNPKIFTSCSAFSPICNPSNVPWGKKALSGYLNNENEWLNYEPCELIKKSKAINPILIHVGLSDQFLNQLTPDNLINASINSNLNGKIQLLKVEGYDHSYYFIQSFMNEHFKFHIQYLK